VLSTDGTEHEVKVDAQTGDVLKVKADDENDEEDAQNQAELAKQAKITEDEAINAALEN